MRQYLAYIIVAIISYLAGAYIGFPHTEISNSQIADNIEYMAFESKYPHGFMRTYMDDMTIQSVKDHYIRYGIVSRSLLESMAGQICKTKIQPFWYKDNITIEGMTLDAEKLINEMLEVE